MENEIKKKIIKGIQITNLEINLIKSLCDYLILDRVKDFATFQRFEQCLGPLFSDKGDFILSEVYKEICGSKRKYITFKRLLSSYINWKSNKSKNKSFNYFMISLFGNNKIIKNNDEVIGDHNNNCQIFST